MYPIYVHANQHEPNSTLLSSSGPLTEMKLAPLSFATALARSVLPQPGGPAEIHVCVVHRGAQAHTQDCKAQYKMHNTHRIATRQRGSSGPLLQTSRARGSEDEWYDEEEGRRGGGIQTYKYRRTHIICPQMRTHTGSKTAICSSSRTSPNAPTSTHVTVCIGIDILSHQRHVCMGTITPRSVSTISPPMHMYNHPQASTCIGFYELSPQSHHVHLACHITKDTACILPAWSTDSQDVPHTVGDGSETLALG